MLCRLLHLVSILGQVLVGSPCLDLLFFCRVRVLNNLLFNRAPAPDLALLNLTTGSTGH
jgi:hypothetical protein